MEQAKKGDWVQISKTVLKPEERTSSLPPETKIVPLTMKLKGFLLNESAKKDENVNIKTVTGRTVNGKLEAINPHYQIDFGKPQPDLMKRGIKAKSILKEGENVVG